MNSFLERLDGIDWSSPSDPEYYDPTAPNKALRALVGITESDDAERIMSNVLYAVGNNHAGTYYPAISKALDFILEIENSGPKLAKIYAREILIDLSCFEPDASISSHDSMQQLSKFVEGRLARFEHET